MCTTCLHGGSVRTKLFTHTSHRHWSLPSTDGSSELTTADNQNYWLPVHWVSATVPLGDSWAEHGHRVKWAGLQISTQAPSKSTHTVMLSACAWELRFSLGTTDIITDRFLGFPQLSTHNYLGYDLTLGHDCGLIHISIIPFYLQSFAIYLQFSKLCINVYNGM
jgi:hypothetical protein